MECGTMRARLFALVCRLRREETGVTMVEYGLILFLIALVCILAVTPVGTQVSLFFSSIAASLHDTEFSTRVE
jgi:pilus assembly protein Flp/PilA